MRAVEHNPLLILGVKNHEGIAAWVLDQRDELSQVAQISCVCRDLVHKSSSGTRHPLNRSSWFRAIETVFSLRLLFRLPLRQTEGFLESILTLMDVTLPCPDHTTLSRRNATVAIQWQIDRAPDGTICLIVDSSGLKVCGQGEWHSQKHGEKSHNRWKKLHIGVDARGRIVASKVTESHEQDPSRVPELLSQVDHRVDRFVGDGIFDQAPVYTAVGNHSPGARVIIPPRKDAVLSPTSTTAPTQRDQHVLAIESEGRLGWKRTSGYYVQNRDREAPRDFPHRVAGGSYPPPAPTERSERISRTTLFRD